MLRELDQKIYQHHPEIVSRLIGGEMILVPIRQAVGEISSIYTLNNTGARIWSLLDGSRTLSDVHAQVVSEFEVDPAQAAADMLELVENLLEQGALVEGEGSS